MIEDGLLAAEQIISRYLQENATAARRLSH
jgi:hypothetical protein